MIIDAICERYDGARYSARDFYYYVSECGEIGWDIARAMDSGNEDDVRASICEYILRNGYARRLCDYVAGQKWLIDDETAAAY